MPNPLRAAAAIVGAVDAVSPDGRLGRTDAQLEVEMIRAALDDAGLSIADVDCLTTTNSMMGPSSSASASACGAGSPTPR